MNYGDYEEFAKEHGIITTEEEAEFGCGYPCSYIYYEPESVMRLVWKLQQKIEDMSPNP